MNSADLIGSWSLAGTALLKDGASIAEPAFPEGTTGYIHYLADGRMAALIATGGPDMGEGLPPFVAYGGRYTLDGDTATHHVDISSGGAVGEHWVRHLDLAGDALTITSPATATTRPMRLFWRRVAAG